MGCSWVVINNILRTPYESLPLTQRAYRQFFRVVTSQVSLSYKDHSTPNPLGVEPDPTITRTVVGDKFSCEGVSVVEEATTLQRWAQEVEHQEQIGENRCHWHNNYPGPCQCNNEESLETAIRNAIAGHPELV